MNQKEVEINLGAGGQTYQCRMVDGIYYFNGVLKVEKPLFGQLITFVGSARSLTISANTLILFVPIGEA